MNRKNVLITVAVAVLIFLGVVGGLLYLSTFRASETLIVTTTSVVVSTQTLTDRIPEYTYANIQVLDEAGQPISGVQISISYSTWIGSETNASGLATVKSRPEPSIQVYKEGYGTTLVSLGTQTVVLKKKDFPTPTRMTYQSILPEIFKVGSKWTYTAVSDTEYHNLSYVDDYYRIFVRRAVFDRPNYLISLMGVDVKMPASSYTDGVSLFSPQIDIVMRP